MTHSSKTRRYTLWCLAARTTAFCALLFYALAAPEQFLADLQWPFHFSPLTVVWLLLMASMVMRLFPSARAAQMHKRWAMLLLGGAGTVPARSPGWILMVFMLIAP